MITDVKLNLKQQQQQQQRLNLMGKQNSVRKMSTMPEEDGSDCAESDSITLHHQDPDHQDSDSPEEHGRLLSCSKKIIVSQAIIASTASTGNGVKRSSSGNSSTDTVYEKLPRGCQSIRLAALDAERSRDSYRDNSVVQCGRISRGLELHGTRHHRYPSMRSLKSNATDDPQHHHNHHHHHHYHHQQQPPTASWASIVFDGGHYGRPFPDSVSIRSLASIGMGSSDGRRLTIRRVPTSPSELLNMVHPPT